MTKTPNGSEKHELVTFPIIVVNSQDNDSQTGRKIRGRIPIYPNSEKLAIDKDAVVDQVVFYSTTDSIDDVKDWYIEYLGGLTKVNMIDILGKDDLRKITISMPDEPKELVEIKERFKGAKDLMITITTIDFYTRTQPRSYEPKESDDTPSDDESSGDDLPNQESQKRKIKDD